MSSSNDSREKRVNSNPRFVRSRYLQSASNKAQKNSSDNSSGGLHSSGSFGTTGSSVNKNVKTKKSALSVKPRVENRIPPTPNIRLNGKLHSTALFNSTSCDKTQMDPDSFSTTVVGVPKFYGKIKEGISPTFSELPDISRICLNTDSDPILENTVVQKQKSLGEEVSEKELEASYLHYLNWNYLDLQSQEVFETQMKNGLDQVAFLTHLIEKEDEALHEERVRLKLVSHYVKMCDCAALLHSLLSNLNELASPCCSALQMLSKHLEVKLNQIKLEGIFVPEESSSYAALLKDVLNKCNEVLVQLNSEVTSEKDLVSSVSALSSALREESDAIQECMNKGERVSSTAIQENSMRICVQ